ncbi:hypothetical protein DENSPDRAFT_334531 [Dentipellis sp. KUC8613]|nr:hypothetical protein DENSPDRAFT_334531 [Dentipellis sp. KUC8613]
MSTSQVAGGHKATLNNPKVSEEAKEHSRQELSHLEQSGALDEARASRDGPKNDGNVIGGHKANLKNPNTSKASKEQSKQFLSSKGADM